MSTVEDDGVYRTGRRRVQRRKKVAVGLTGLAAVVAGGAWAVSAWRTAQDGLIAGDVGASRPAVIASAPSAPTDSSPSPGEGAASPSAAARSAPTPPSPRLSGARQSTRPSPTPSPSAMSDREVAAAQVGRLVQEPSPAAGQVAAADAAIMVVNETGADGSAIRVLSARHDLGRQLWAADGGRQVGLSRCTQNLRIGGRRAEVRPGLMVCWRVSDLKSVVTVATRAGGAPLAEASARVLDRTWQNMG